MAKLTTLHFCFQNLCQVWRMLGGMCSKRIRLQWFAPCLSAIPWHVCKKRYLDSSGALHGGVIILPFLADRQGVNCLKLPNKGKL